MIAPYNWYCRFQRIIVPHDGIGTGHGQIIDYLGINRIPEIYGRDHFGTDQVLGNNHIIVVGIIVNHCLAQLGITGPCLLELVLKIGDNLFLLTAKEVEIIRCPSPFCYIPNKFPMGLGMVKTLQGIC